MGDKCEICNGNGYRAHALIGYTPCGFCNGSGTIQTLAEAIADVILPKMTKPRFKAWYGGMRPVKENQDTERLYRSGRTYDFHDERGWDAWEHVGDSHDIIAYRVIEQE